MCVSVCRQRHNKSLSLLSLPRTCARESRANTIYNNSQYSIKNGQLFQCFAQPPSQQASRATGNKTVPVARTHIRTTRHTTTLVLCTLLRAERGQCAFIQNLGVRACTCTKLHSIHLASESRAHARTHTSTSKHAKCLIGQRPRLCAPLGWALARAHRHAQMWHAGTQTHTQMCVRIQSADSAALLL